jgi:hypothetical protein
MTNRILCAVALAALFVLAGGCSKKDHGHDHPHGEGSDHSHGTEKGNPGPPTRTEVVPAAEANVPVKNGDAGTVAGDEARGPDEEHTATEASTKAPAKRGHRHDERSGHKHGDGQHKH